MTTSPLARLEALSRTYQPGHLLLTLSRDPTDDELAQIKSAIAATLRAEPVVGECDDDLCDLAAELERFGAYKIVNDVAALAQDRTDGYWSGLSMACEEIKFRMKEAWGGKDYALPPPAALPGLGG